jgi:Matrixin
MVLCPCFSIFTVAVVHAETEYAVGLQGVTWDDSVIDVLITPPSNVSWWNPSYLNATLHSISQWNEAIASFAGNYSDFAYLSRLRMVPQFSNSSANADFDAYLSWIKEFGNVTCEAGLSRTTYMSGIITNNSVTIAAYDCRGNVLSEADSQNVALHELGHVLGLKHSNYTDDLMYFAYSLSSPVRAVSTLDLYGVAVVFQWMAVSLEFDKANIGSRVYSVSLPPEISYEYLEVSEGNLPPQSLFEQVRNYLWLGSEAIAKPEFWVFMVLLTVALATVFAVLKRVRRKQALTDNAASTRKQTL